MQGLGVAQLTRWDVAQEIAARHGIEISARRVDRVLDTVDEEDEGLSAWRRVLEQTTGALLRQSGEREVAKT